MLLSERAHERWLFGVLFASFCFFQQGGSDNVNSRFDAAMALGFEHHLSIDTFAANTIDEVHVGDHYFSEKAPGATYLTLPVTFIASLFFSEDEARGETGNGLLYIATCLSLALVSAIAAVFFRRLLRAFAPAMPAARATAMTALVYLGTMLLPYSTSLFGHALAAAFVVIAFERLSPLLADEPTSLARDVQGVLACSAAVFSEYPALIAVAPLLVCALWRHPRRLIRALPVALIPAALLMWHQYASFGNPFTPGYGKLANTPFATQMNSGFFGIGLPRPGAALQLLVGIYRGLFVYCPLLVFAVAGFFFTESEKQKRLFTVAGTAATLLWLLNASYGYWQGGACFGPRHLVMAIPLLALGLMALPARWWTHPLFIVTAVLSVAINLLGTATTLIVSEHDAAPLSHAYWHFLSANEVSVNPMSWATPVAERGEHWRHLGDYASASWNLGEKLGLSGFVSLLPLLILWAAAGYFLSKARNRAVSLKV